MTYRVKVTLRAQKDLEELFCWVLHRAPQQGSLWYNGLLKAIKSISRNPQRCSIAIEGKELRQPARQLLYGKRPYRIFFWIVDREVHVLHIRRGTQRPWNLEL